ncbi:DUF4834 family protein [Salibacteraceae bacterium]|nr:DUF4834 family protein [Salibacteraceae bacterium]
MGLVRTLLIIGLIYFGVRIIMRVIFPWAIKFFFKKVQNKMADQMKHQNNQGEDPGFQKSGDVFVKPPPKKNKGNIEPKGGEYVDFEEVE